MEDNGRNNFWLLTLLAGKGGRSGSFTPLCILNAFGDEFAFWRVGRDSGRDLAWQEEMPRLIRCINKHKFHEWLKAKVYPLGSLKKSIQMQFKNGTGLEGGRGEYPSRGNTTDKQIAFLCPTAGTAQNMATSRSEANLEIWFQIELGWHCTA